MLNVFGPFMGPRFALPPGHHYDIDPDWGVVGAVPDIDDLVGRPDPTPERDYGLDPEWGTVVRQPSIRTFMWTEADQRIADRGWAWGIDPETGRRERRPTGPRHSLSRIAERRAH